MAPLLFLMCREAGGDARAGKERERLYACSQSLLHGADQAAAELVSHLTPTSSIRTFLLMVLILLMCVCEVYIT